MPLKIVNIVGARPNFMKIAPLMEEYKKHPDIEPILVHTGQHYDEKMSDLFFRQLGIPEPDINLGVGSGSHAQQTAEIMKRFEPVLVERKPDAVLVVGDVNSTIACGLVAVKLGIKLIHYEAGLRSFDRTMPEETNRILTDAISNLLLCTEESGVDNLLAAGIDKHRVHLVGNLMIDTLINNREAAAKSQILDHLGARANAFAVVTLHRPSNVDNLETLLGILGALKSIQEQIPLYFPIHPRTKASITSLGLDGAIRDMPNLTLTNPMGYLDFLHLMASARLIITDSGGMQEEATILRTPCVTVRDNTERPSTVKSGGNIVCGTNTERILSAFQTMKDVQPHEILSPPKWDGATAPRILSILRNIGN